MMKETNMEHYRGEVEDIKYDFGKQKDSSTGKEYLISCTGVNCQRCDFFTGNNMDDDLFNCMARKTKWLMSEYKPEPVLTQREKGFVECIGGGWLARDKDGNLTWFEDQPERSHHEYIWTEDIDYDQAKLCDMYFPFITWEDEEPWSVEELRKLKVEGC